MRIKARMAVGLAVLTWGFLAWADETPPRFQAPTTYEQTQTRLDELARQYQPYLRSLPAPLDDRPRTPLPREWKFAFEAKRTPKPEGIPAAPPWFGPDFDDSKWEPATVPEWRYRTAQSDTAVAPDQVAVFTAKTSTADTICWYRTRFAAQPTPAGQRVWLCFDGVDWEAEVYLNGRLLGRHSVYYEPFRFDVTGKLQRENLLAVRVIDGRSYGEPMTYWGPFPDIRAADQRYTPDRSASIRGNLPIGYHAGTGFGIHREAYLERTGPVRIGEVFARNDLTDARARVKVELDAAAAATVELRAAILAENFDAPPAAPYEKAVKCELKAGAGEATLEVPMPDARPWSPDQPNLYRCRVTVLDPATGRTLDSRDALFGCRSFALVRHPSMPLYTFAPLKARFLRILGRGSDRSEWNSIWEVDCPALRRTPESVTASKHNQDYTPAKALDNDRTTRWAAQGRGHWIQFELDPTVELSAVRIGWFEAGIRAWDFDLLTSDDGTTWKKLAYQAATPPGPHAGLSEGTFLLNGRPVFLRGTNIHGLNVYAYWGQREQLLRAVLLLKAAHFNAVRVCQHVQFSEVRELLDRLGMMSEQDQGGGYRGSLDGGIRRQPHIRTGAVLARTCYNNPGVVLLCFGNEHHFDTEPILRSAMAVDPQRVFKPISGRFSHSHQPLTLPDELWPHVIDDGHPYSGWYGDNWPQTWRNLQVYGPRRMVTLGEYGAEALDAYQTMRDHYPPQFRPPPADSDTLWAAAQVAKHDPRQVAGLGRKPANLGEYIEASQNYQEGLLADKTIGMRLSPRAVAGYFQFHFIDVVPVHWPKSIVSHDQRPKKAYYQMAQVNQPVTALPQLLGQRPDAVVLHVANDLDEPFPQATLAWTVSSNGKELLSGSRKLDVPATGTAAGPRIDLSAVVDKHPQFDLLLSVSDSRGRTLSRYQRTVRRVPAKLLKK